MQDGIVNNADELQRIARARARNPNYMPPPPLDLRELVEAWHHDENGEFGEDCYVVEVDLNPIPNEVAFAQKHLVFPPDAIHPEEYDPLDEHDEFF